MKIFLRVIQSLWSARTPTIFLLFTGFLLVRTILMPLTFDDHPYAFIWDGERGGNLQMIMRGTPELEHRTWGGRVLAHSIVQFFMWLGKPAFDVANAIIFAAFVLLIAKLADAHGKISRTAVTWIFFCLLFISCGSMSTLYWLTGSCNYLWMAFVQIFFLTPYVKVLLANKVESSAPKFLLMILLGLMAGLSNEAGASATVGLTTSLIGVCKIRGLLRPWMFAGLAALSVGCAVMIFAPGNFLRLEFDHPNWHYSTEIFLGYLRGEFFEVVIASLIALLPAIIYFWRRRGGKFTVEEILMLAFTATSFLVPTIMLFAPEFTVRVSMNSMTFALVASSMAIVELERQHFTLNLQKNFRRGICAGVTILFLTYCASLIYVDVTVFNATRRQENFIRQHAELDPIELPPLDVCHTFDKIHGDRNLNFYTNHFGGIVALPIDCRNIFVSQFYGAKRVVAVGDMIQLGTKIPNP